MVIAKVIQADVLTTWQDMGRVHSTHHGVGEGGVMDVHAACWANRLLGRNIRQPVIEITLGLFALQFEHKCQIAITGADMQVSLNNKPILIWQSYTVQAGDQLHFKTAKSGIRAYLAMNAAIELKTIFNSASTVIREQFLGLLGRPLRVGDQIIGAISDGDDEAQCKHVPSSFIPNYAEPLELELIPSCQFDQFPNRAIDQFLNSEFKIQASSNRMAYLFAGQAIEHSIQTLDSQGIAYGAVQVPPDGQPIILLNDRQSMGGYPKLGCISRLSGSALSQRFAPSKVSFKLTTVAATTASYREMMCFFNSKTD